jgi:hypothetical protein
MNNMRGENKKNSKYLAMVKKKGERKYKKGEKKEKRE